MKWPNHFILSTSWEVEEARGLPNPCSLKVFRARGHTALVSLNSGRRRLVSSATDPVLTETVSLCSLGAGWGAGWGSLRNPKVRAAFGSRVHFFSSAVSQGEPVAFPRGL